MASAFKVFLNRKPLYRDQMVFPEGNKAFDMNSGFEVASFLRAYQEKRRPNEIIKKRMLKHENIKFMKIVIVKLSNLMF